MAILILKFFVIRTFLSQIYCEQLKLNNLRIFNNLKLDKMKAKLYYLIAIVVLAPLMCVQAQICDDPLINGVLFVPYAEMPIP